MLAKPVSLSVLIASLTAAATPADRATPAAWKAAWDAASGAGGSDWSRATRPGGGEGVLPLEGAWTTPAAFVAELERRGVPAPEKLWGHVAPTGREAGVVWAHHPSGVVWVEYENNPAGSGVIPVYRQSPAETLVLVDEAVVNNSDRPTGRCWAVRIAEGKATARRTDRCSVWAFRPPGSAVKAVREALAADADRRRARQAQTEMSELLNSLRRR
jgi:hypothetical protein